MEHSTIAAIATPGGRGGIGIVKISGSKALSIASAIFSPVHSPSSINPDPLGSEKNGFGDAKSSHQLYYGHIVDRVEQRVLDEVLLSVMKAPRSYTREDVIEINAHGGPVALNAILELVLRQGARIAEPGEFTKRAFLNGRIDLAQAEAVIDVINARSQKSLQMAAAQINGRLSQAINKIQQRLVDLLTRIEAGIDFPDDVPELIDPATVTAGIQADVINPLEDLIQRHLNGNPLRDGLKVAVVGRPNVGKSSLLNCLVQKERVIVTDVPGTTRDTIEENFNIDGFPMVIADTAGMHDTADPIESVGIQKTIENAKDADLILFMVEANRDLTADDHIIYRKFQSQPTLILMNKIDLVKPGRVTELPVEWGSRQCLKISALYGHGIEALKEQIVATAFGKNPIDIESGIVPNLRQKLLLEDSLTASRAVCREVNNGLPMELIAIQLQDAIDALGQILGANVKVDILEQIFSRFCIGK